MKTWVAACALLGACYSMSTVQEPRPLPRGAVRGAVGMGFDVPKAGPSAQLAGRVGLGGGTEARLKLAMPRHESVFVGLETGVNWQPWDSGRVGIFLMPHYRYYRIEEDDDGVFDEYCCDERTIQAFAMPSLVVFHLRPYDLFVGPDLHAGTRQRRGFLALGGHAGGSVQAGKHVHLTLEGALLGSVAGPPRSRDENGYLDQALTVGDVTAEIAFSISFGSAYLK